MTPAATAAPPKPKKRPCLLSVIGFVTYLYLLRFPILSWLIIVALPIVALTDSGQKMLAGSFDQWRWYQISSLSLVAVMTASTLFITGRLVLDYSAIRRSAPFRLLRLTCWRRVWLIVSTLSILPSLAVAFYYSSDEVRPWPFLMFGALGLTVAAVIIVLIWYVFVKVIPRFRFPFEDRFIVWIARPLMLKFGGIETVQDL